MSRLTLDQRADGWWIVDPDDDPAVNPQDLLPDHGPYDTKTLANEDRRGLERFLKANPEL